MLVKPKGGALLRHPVTKLALPSGGGDLPDDYAMRRIRDGDAEPVSATPPARSAKTEE